MIDYSILDDAVKYYESKGFKRIESPWTVSEYVDSITRPKGVTPFKLVHNGKNLVGSGEQSFLYLYLKGFLPKGRFQTVTPCFRFESFDYLHSKYFMKDELIITDNVTKEGLEEIIVTAIEFFGKHLEDVRVTKTGDLSYDITCDGVELGSYGIRKSEFLTWIYGTGCAEPRLSNTINLKKKK